MTDVNFTDNSQQVLSALERGTLLALKAIGMSAEGHAKEEITKAGVIDTGRLRNSISYKVENNSAFIGTNVEYAQYIEFGTGIYAPEGYGRKEPWVYKDSKGKWHFTRGVKPVHFLKKAATEHNKEYKNLAKEALESVE